MHLILSNMKQPQKKTKKNDLHVFPVSVHGFMLFVFFLIK